MNNKGFTMIELLASMVLLSILMLTAVPTVLRVMDDSRKTTITNDAKKFVSSVEYKIKHNNNYIKRPKKQNDCILITLGYLDLSSEFKEGPHGGSYSLDDSFVVVKLKSMSTYGNASDADKVQMYDYYVTLIENYDDNANYGVYLVPFDKLNNGHAKQYVDGIGDTKLFSKNKVLLRNTITALGGTNQLGCNNDLENKADRITDKVYDTDDSLREQGIGE